MKTLESRIAELERELAQVKRDLARKEVRPAAPLIPQRGWYLGIVREDFTKGEDDYIKCDIWIWSITDNDWRKVPGLTNEIVRDFFLADETEVTKNTKLKIEWYETTWVATAIMCSEEEEEESPGGSPGEQEGSIPDSIGGELAFDTAFSPEWSDVITLDY